MCGQLYEGPAIKFAHGSEGEVGREGEREGEGEGKGSGKQKRPPKNYRDHKKSFESGGRKFRSLTHSLDGA